MQILPHTDLIATPWKNGGGVTRKIAAGLQGDHTLWTISRADVATDGPFSDFTGMMRVLTVVSGGAMVLDTPYGPLAANPWSPVRFDGGIPVQSRLLDGPLTDLNLMFDPAQCDGQVMLRQGFDDGVIAAPRRGLLAFHILAGAPTVNGTALGTGDTAFTDKPAAVSLAAGDAVLELRLAYADTAAIRLCIANR